MPSKLKKKNEAKKAKREGRRVPVFEQRLGSVAKSVQNASVQNVFFGQISSSQRVKFLVMSEIG